MEQMLEVIEKNKDNKEVEKEKQIASFQCEFGHDQLFVNGH